MTPTSINSDFIAPILALVVWTCIIWVILYIRRLGFIKANNIDPEIFKTMAGRKLMDGPQNYAAENYNHLFEMPVLFYVVTLLLVMAGVTDVLALMVAWTYVGLRIVHSLIQITYNKIMHRFLVFFLSSIVMFILVGRTVFLLM